MQESHRKTSNRALRQVIYFVGVRRFGEALELIGNERNGRLGSTRTATRRDRCPRAAPQPTVSIVRRSIEVFHGPLATSKGVRLFGTDALRYQPLDPAVAFTSLFQTRPHYVLCDPGDRCRQM